MNEHRRAMGATDRLEFIDSLRGFALFGVFWANLLIFAGVSYMTDEQRAGLFTGSLDSTVYFLERFFIENKFIGLFSFLFGISFWLFISRARSRGGAGTALFFRRIGWLFAIGLIHGALLWWGDVLRFYALWAILLPLFARMAPRRLLTIALGAGVLVPALVSGVEAWVPKSPQMTTDFDAVVLGAFTGGSYAEAVTANLRYDGHITFSVGQIAYQVAVFGRLLLGLYVGRTLQLANLENSRALLRKVLVAGTLCGGIGSTVFAANLLLATPDNAAVAFLRRLVVEGGQLGLTLAYASGLAMLFLHAAWRPTIRLLAPIGRMALTWYLLQTVFGVWVFYGFANGPSLMGKLGAAPIAGIALVGFGIQIVVARVWLGRFQFGPAEWVWRTLTYWKLQPLLKTPPLEAGQQQHAADGAARRR